MNLTGDLLNEIKFMKARLGLSLFLANPEGKINENIDRENMKRVRENRMKIPNI